MPPRRSRWARTALVAAVVGWLSLGAVLAAHPGHLASDGLTGDGLTGDGLNGGGLVAEGKSPVAKGDSRGGDAVEGERRFSRGKVLVLSLTVFVLAVFVGFEVINKVPPTLHTPLMSGSNAVSGITVVGAILAASSSRWGFATWLAVLAIMLANINVVGGFLVTHRMLMMFKKR